MASARVTSKGRITIPVGVRKAMQIEAGDRVEFIQIASDRYELLAANREVAELKGMFGKARSPVSIKDQHVAIAKRAWRS